MALYLTEAEIGGLLTMPDVVDALEEMFRARARGEIVNRPRVRVPITAGSYNVMPAGWIERGVVGQKMYTASAKGASFQIVLSAADGSGLLAVMGGGRISGLRTGAATGLAARHLATEPGGPIAVIGAGFQATAQVNGLVAATGATDIRVYARSAEKREGFAGADGRVDRSQRPRRGLGRGGARGRAGRRDDHELGRAGPSRRASPSGPDDHRGRQQHLAAGARSTRPSSAGPTSSSSTTSTTPRSKQAS